MPLDDSTAISIGPYRCWDEGHGASFKENEQTSWRVLRCLSTIALPLTLYLKGQTSGTAGYVPPQRDPRIPWLFVNTVDWTGQMGSDPVTGQPQGLTTNASDGMVDYKYKFLKVTYTTLDWIALTQIGSLSIDIAAQWLSAPGPDNGNPPSCQFGTGSMAPDVTFPVAFPIVVIDYQKGVYNLTSLPMAKIQAAAASPLNSTTVTDSASGLVAPPGTLLYFGSSDTRKIDLGGAENWNINHHFKYRAVEWDKGLNPKTGTFDQILVKGTLKPLLARSDLNVLLTP